MPQPGQVRIVTDSTSDLPPEVRERYGIVTVPLSIQFGSDSYRDNQDLTPAEFYRKQDEAEFPTTAQPSAGAFEEAYRRLHTEGASGVLCLCFSSKLSGTYNSAVLAAQTVGDEFPTEVIDTQTATMGLGFLVIEAAKKAEAGASLDECAARVRELMPHLELVFVLNTLEFLAAGGRISKAKSLMGSVLSIKPLLKFEHGQLEPFQQPRTRAKALDALVQWVFSIPDPAKVGVFHDGTPETLPEAHAIVERLSAKIPRDRISVGFYGTTYGVHLGPKASGAVVLKKL